MREISLNLQIKRENQNQQNMLPMLEAEAAERRKGAGGDHKSDSYKKSVGVNLPQPIDQAREPASTDVAAKLLGISGHLKS